MVSFIIPFCITEIHLNPIETVHPYISSTHIVQWPMMVLFSDWSQALQAQHMLAVTVGCALAAYSLSKTMAASAKSEPLAELW